MTDKELRDRIAEAAGADPDAEVDWTPHREPSKSPTAVYSVRIPVDRIEELRRLATERGVQPTALIRAWVLAQLDAARAGDEGARQWENDVRATIDHLRALLDERTGVPHAS
ncbi:hypothetical protein DMA12_13705 [Amycolatopsis balhimycina DSM 5908]|uniref:Uncharacterized protein n=1 Tax=Amycolatopsis balhimycina DSM 5908 TaxID=1081091 RepID=A0A428WR53_AMYBA|nr:hypothetical protein [Amycolatopsis balhimycina]RSM45513.1 hypothetical protein DMA12_13705 [Amycolatopsis balhimycina DSM 5908]